MKIRAKDRFKRVRGQPEKHDKVIRIDGEVYEYIKMFAVPLKDTPCMVLRRLLKLDPELSEEEKKKTEAGQQL